VFLKDFDVRVNKAKLHEIYLKVSKEPMTLAQFKEALPHFGLAHCKAKTKEVKFRLREIKKVLEYPGSKIEETLSNIINGIEPS